jgi:hypothetical protein
LLRNLFSQPNTLALLEKITCFDRKQLGTVEPNAETVSLL